MYARGLGSKRIGMSGRNAFYGHHAPSVIRGSMEGGMQDKGEVYDVGGKQRTTVMPLPFLVLSSHLRWSSVQGDRDICTR